MPTVFCYNILNIVIYGVTIIRELSKKPKYFIYL